MENQVTKYRSELKYVFKSSEYSLIKNQIISYGFEKAHDYNIVNNIYFDYNQNSLIDNIEGESLRTKFRIRWYNDFNGKCIFENKSKIGNSGTKTRINLKIKNIQDANELKKKVKPIINVNKFKPNIQNRYFREYFINNGIRITLDSNIKYFRYGESNFNIYEPKNIMEVKFDNHESFELDFLNKIIYLKLDKYSKYLNAMNLLKVYN
ncbi:MAG: VTC domain-containing protein [Flavobacteriaceae bacterium]|nr:VTC domain-containing protein [Flavobacteriaceae bacterium]